MAIVVLKLPDVKREREERPQQCPYCSGETFQRWGGGEKPVRDVHCRRVWVYRYRCCHCGRTFRHYPVGSRRADQTERLKSFAVICWRLGLSHRSVSRILSGLNTFLSHMSVWRDAQAQAETIRHRNRWRKVRVLGVDGALVRGWGGQRPVLVAVDLGQGAVIEVGQVEERDPQAVRRWLQSLTQRLGVSVIVTDDLYLYRTVSEQLQLGHQVCQFHARRWVGKTLKALQETVPKDWHWVIEEVKELIEFLPPEGDKRLYALWKQVSVRRAGRGQALTALEQLRDLLLRLSQRWQSYCTFQGEPHVPWTNNQTEQAIGRLKMRARTVRGYKTWPGMRTGLLLAGGFPF
jgi:transposase-like protein/DNA-directed RNA polymerase subunit RPC12/RpoP